MSEIPVQHFRNVGPPPEQAFEAWRTLMAPMYEVGPLPGMRSQPTGAVTAYLLGDVMANHTLFAPQRVTRDRRRIDSTPDHVLLQIWRGGSYRGEIAGRPFSIVPGQVALANRRHELDGYIIRSDSLGLAVPRARLEGVDVDRLGLHLDPIRNRLLLARIDALYRTLPELKASDVPATLHELLAFLRRLFDPSSARDVLEGRELDRGVADLALQVMRLRLADPGLTPQAIADALHVSRATLYRAFAARGGLMQILQQERLEAVRHALSDPLEQRSLTQLAGAYGFSSLSLLSRSYRARFGLSPRAWRVEHLTRLAEAGPAAAIPLRVWWNNLGL